MASPTPNAPFSVLLAMRRRLVHNRINQLLDQSPARVLVTVVFIAAIWMALYLLFNEVFGFLRRSQEQSAVAIPYVFHIFFVAMLVLLAFSAAVLCYSALFTREEPGFLLTGPTRSTHVVGIAYLESLFFSSWAMILLGVPLMAAIGRAQDLPIYFYPIFVLSFLGFVPIPGALGLLAAWAVAMWMPRNARRVLGWSVAIVLVGGLVWWGRLWQPNLNREQNDWLDSFMSQLVILRTALLPSSWTSRAIQFALEARAIDSLYYLFVTLANGLFLSWLAVMVVARYLQPAYGRSQSRTSQTMGQFGSQLASALTDMVFAYLRPRMRMLVLKDLKTFVRDPAQWSQLAILFGLLSLYLFYLPQYRAFGMTPTMRALICFLNYGAVTLIISTFTSRFVFPMVSMEGLQIWLVGLWPLSRASVLWAKFQFAFAVTTFATLSVSALSVRAINLTSTMALLVITSTVSVCFGLCGMAIGLGACMPSYQERSAARVAAGLGGTVNLVMSMCLVLLSLAIMGGMCWQMRVYEVSLIGPELRFATRSIWFMGATQILVGVSAGLLSMRIGSKKFTRAEF